MDPRPALATTTQPVFYYDLGSPDCYLVAEQVMHALPIVPEWQPVLATELGGGERTIDRSQLEHRAAELGIQPLRWPERLSPDSTPAMLAATYAKQIGRGVAFSLAALRQVFAAGRDLGDTDTILLAGAACEMHPNALLKAITSKSVAHALAATTAQARQQTGVRGSRHRRPAWASAYSRVTSRLERRPPSPAS